MVNYSNSFITYVYFVFDTIKLCIIRFYWFIYFSSLYNWNAFTHDISVLHDNIFISKKN